jgi:hypothetical protein
MAKADNPVWTGCEKTRQVRSTFLVEQNDGAEQQPDPWQKKKKSSK